MTTILNLEVVRRVWGGFAGARDPIGHWHQATANTGDATGGSNVINLVFQQQAAPNLDPQIYSVEQVAVQLDAAPFSNVRIRSVVMGDLSGADGYVCGVNAAGSQDFGAIAGSNLTWLPIFLGSARTQGSTTALEFAMDNVDTQNLIVSAQGYIWGSRSRSAPGGPRRPVGGMYPP